MYTHEMIDGLNQAETTLRAADNCAKDVAKLLVGRLRKATPNNYCNEHDVLRALKRELSQYNSKTGKWKS